MTQVLWVGKGESGAWGISIPSNIFLKCTKLSEAGRGPFGILHRKALVTQVLAVKVT